MLLKLIATMRDFSKFFQNFTFHKFCSNKALFGPANENLQKLPVVNILENLRIPLQVQWRPAQNPTTKIN